jgi:tRNA pseudouridine55 synthase
MLIAVDKPIWISSFDVIRVLKRELWEKKIWHSWTLDPLASWLMLLGTWDDTKKLNNLIWLDKSYETIIDFSKKSDTRDMWYRDYYEEINVEWKEIPLEDIKSKLDLLIPEYELPLTPFSAKKKDWKKLYDLARKWEQIVENRIMKTYGYEVLDYNFPELKLRLDVGSWTYIRSIWHLLWEQFCLEWILTMLRRIRVWDYKMEEINLDKEWTFFRKEWDDISFKYWTVG